MTTAARVKFRGAPTYIGLLHGFHVWLDTNPGDTQPFMFHPEHAPHNYGWLYGTGTSVDKFTLREMQVDVPPELLEHLASIRQLL